MGGSRWESLRPCNLRCGPTLAGKLLGYPTLAELRQIPIHLQVWGYLLRCVICIHSHRGCSASQMYSHHFPGVYFTLCRFFSLIDAVPVIMNPLSQIPTQKQETARHFVIQVQWEHGLSYLFHVEQDMLTRRRPLLEGYAHALRPLPERSV